MQTCQTVIRYPLTYINY